MSDNLILAEEIAIRATALAAKHGRNDYRTNEIMGTILMVHARHRLRLTDLLNATEGNFAHDVFGIMRHYEPVSRTLTDCFTPRYSV